MGGETTLTRRTLLGTALLLNAAPALAVGRGAKRISLLTRPAATDRATFVNKWMELARSRSGAAPRHLVLSEVMGGGEGDPFDAFATIWSSARTVPLLPTVPGSNALDLTVDEHVFASPDRSQVHVKRTLLIARKPAMTHDAFVRYWLAIHGPLSRGVPGLAGCVFNVVDERDAASSGIDGIAESWWTGAGTEQGGKVRSPQADRWAADGANFIEDAGTRLLLTRDHVLR